MNAIVPAALFPLALLPADVFVEMASHLPLLALLALYRSCRDFRGLLDGLVHRALTAFITRNARAIFSRLHLDHRKRMLLGAQYNLPTMLLEELPRGNWLYLEWRRDSGAGVGHGCIWRRQVAIDYASSNRSRVRAKVEIRRLLAERG